MLEAERLNRYRKRFRAVLFFLWLFLFCAGILCTTLFLHRHSLAEGALQLRAFLERREELFLLILFLTYLARAVIFIPVSVLGALTGIALSQEPIFAISFATVATTLTAFLSFGIARALGRKWVAEHETPRLKKFDEKVQERGFFTIFILRILIIVPFDLVNLASGFSSMRFRDFALASFLGIIPEVAVQVLIGHSLERFWHLPHSLLQFKTLLLILIIGLALYGVGKFLKTNPHFRDILDSGKKENNKKT